MIDYNEDFMLCHMLSSTHMPEVLLSVFKSQHIDVDLKIINKKSEEIFNEKFVGEDPSSALLIAMLLLRQLYSLFAVGIPTNPTEQSPKKLCITKEFIQGYN